MVATAKVFGEKLPDASIPKLASGDSPTFESVLGSPMKLYTASFKAGGEHDQPEWFVRIEPLFVSPRYYFVQLTCRDKKLSTVMDASQKTEEFIKNIVSTIESE